MASSSWLLRPSGSSTTEATSPYYYPGFFYGGLYERYRRNAESRYNVNRPIWSMFPAYGGYSAPYATSYNTAYRPARRPAPTDAEPFEVVSPDPTPPPTPPATPPPEAEEPVPVPEEKLPDLNFVSLDLLVNENRKDHHTDKYFNKTLILRRGQVFKLQVKLSEAFNKTTDRILLKFKKGSDAQYSKGTCFLVSSEEDDNDYLANGWTASVSDTIDNDVILNVTSDVDSVIGHFSFSLKVKRTSKTGRVQVDRMKTEEKMIVLFNAFLPEDDAYMEEERERTEYVISDIGLIFTNIYSPRNWVYGQYEENILETALYLMDKSKDLPPTLHGNIVKTLRAMSAMVNANDDGGVLVGNWSGSYEDGVSPSTWNGSVAILQKYWDTKQSVLYGQCWVFAAVLVTVMRALGLATRAVTNFGSAHDTNKSMTIDKYINWKGEPVKSKNHDSTWNFHVWNECWTKRSDLAKGYDGWQAFDSTPQEYSDGMFQCGPCPVTAIYKGEVHIPYDAEFIFAEVNADTVYWKVNKDKSEVPYAINSHAVGRDMSTKMPGQNWRLDVTKFYKGKEDSDAERRAAINAMKSNKSNWSRIKQMYEEVSKDWDIKFSLECKIDPNEDCHFKVTMENTSDKVREVDGKMNLYACYNVGMSRKDLHEPNTSKLSIPGGQTETVEWNMLARDYFNKLDDDADLLLHAAFFVEDTKQVWSQSDIINIIKPEMFVTLEQEEVQVGDEIEVTVTFKNPISVDLTDVKINVEGLGMETISAPNNSTILKAEDNLQVKTKLKTKRPGDKVIIASFDSRELMGLSGITHVNVTGEEME